MKASITLMLLLMLLTLFGQSKSNESQPATDSSVVRPLPLMGTTCYHSLAPAGKNGAVVVVTNRNQNRKKMS